MPYMSYRFSLMSAIFLIICVIPFTGICAADNSVEVRAILAEASSVLESDPKRASGLANRALKLCDTAHPDSATIAATVMYGEAEQLLGNFDLSIHILYDAEGLIKDGDTQWKARLYKLQGRVFSKLGDYQKSAELNDRATSMFRASGDSALVADCYNERGVMLLNLHEYVIAEHFFRRALEINRKLKNLKGIAKNLNSMCLYSGDSNEKLGMIEEAIAINKHLGNNWALGENFNNKGKQLYYARRPDDAKTALAQAKVYIDSIEAKELLCDNYEYLSMVYAMKGDYRKAYEYLGMMSDLSTQLQKNNRLRDTELDLSRKKFEDQRIAIDKQEQEYKIELLTRNIILLVTFIVLCAVCLLLYYIENRHKKNLQLIETRNKLEMSAKEVDSLKVRQQQLELENAQTLLESNRRELTGFAAFLKSRNEIMDKIKEMIKEGYKMDSSLIGAHLKKINAFITTNCTNDKNGTTFLLNVEERNKDFLMRLIEKHPSLTKGERNLALLIRGKLSTKEISLLLGLEPRTVNMNRYRLRKSLALNQEDSLEEYLRNV